MQSIYKLVTRKGEKLYRLMTGEDAQTKNQERAKINLSTRWLPVENTDVPPNAEVIVNERPVKMSDLSFNTDPGFDPEDKPTPAMPAETAPAVNAEPSEPATAIQFLPSPEPPVSVAATPEQPDWYKGEVATMLGDKLAEIYEEHLTDPRQQADIPQAEWEYMRDVREEVEERTKMERQQKEDAAKSAEPQPENNEPEIFESNAVTYADHMGDTSDEEFAAEQEGRTAREVVSPYSEAKDAVEEFKQTHPEKPEPLQVYNLVGTGRVEWLYPSEAKLINQNIKGEWLYSPELEQFARPRGKMVDKFLTTTGFNTFDSGKSGKWNGLSKSKLLKLCGSEEIPMLISREVVKRLTGKDVPINTAATMMSRGRHADATELPKLDRHQWAEFYDAIKQVTHDLKGNEPELAKEDPTWKMSQENAEMLKRVADPNDPAGKATLKAGRARTEMEKHLPTDNSSLCERLANHPLIEELSGILSEFQLAMDQKVDEFLGKVEALFDKAGK